MLIIAMTTAVSDLISKNEKCIYNEIQPFILNSAKEINNRKVGSLLVVHRNGKAKGFTTERDLVGEVRTKNVRTTEVKITK